MRYQKGNALPLALAALAIATLLAVPMVRTFGTIRASNTRVPDHYAADAGIEDAIWRLTTGDLADELVFLGDSTSYDLDQTFNDNTVTVKVTKGYGMIAEEDFESAGWTGGTGWAQDWTHSGTAAVLDSGTPQQGSYHLLLDGATDRVERSVDLSSALGYDVLLYFWAKAKSFQSGEEVRLLISSDGVEWDTIATWVNGDDDNVYRFFSFDIPPEITGTLWIAFQTNMSGPSSYFYVDHIRVLRTKLVDSGETPSDNFESHDWEGGFYWLSPWNDVGNVSITPSRDPYEGQYHVEINGPVGYISRSADLSKFSFARLQFWAKGSHIEIGDYVDCLVINDALESYSLRTWTFDDSDYTYRFVTADIPIEALTPNAQIVFWSFLSGASDHFNIDDLRIVGSITVFEIVSTAGGITTRAIVSISDTGDVDIIYHHTEGTT